MAPALTLIMFAALLLSIFSSPWPLIGFVLGLSLNAKASAVLLRIPRLAPLTETKTFDIEVIVQALERLAEVRIGAILAIQQSIQLQDIVESGVPVDCETTPEMLETIFFPNNAIHDGGVILIGNRIAFAACIFPLTLRQDLSKAFGTRHRAAIGLVEETDAVVLVVSEETGNISYAYKGHLIRNVTGEEARAFLTSLFVRPVKRRFEFRPFSGKR